MSTPTDDPQILEEGTASDHTQQPRTFQGWLLIVQVFVAGAASLAVEMSAMRQLPIYFGDTVLATSSLIGLILLYLTVGYYLGGYQADRHPSTRLFYGITAIAALLISLIPLIAPPILRWSQLTFLPNSPLNVFLGSLVAVIIIFAIPTILLGCTSPFAIRLSVEQIGKLGQTSGMLYAISTAGSIVGTFLSVLVFLPQQGTTRTFIIFAAALLVVSLIGLIVGRNSGTKQ
ncbi:MAG TPA: fused MFS/spermidine synthase [Ktedonobacteraceae bacterium]|jgi:predicted membrane-bound spermidine synthase